MKSSLTDGVSPDLNRHYPCSYGEAIPKSINNQHHYNSIGRKKSTVRLNDELIPKPTDINVAEKMIKIATPKEHPYSSHISRFAMFPSFRSPDDPDTGVRGGPYRHELLKSPPKTRKKAVTWTGQHGFLDHTKPLKGEIQAFYPTLPKTVLPNPELRDWDLSLSERTCNILKNLERKLWVTSYQMHYTGSGPANPLKTDDFKEKISTLTGINSHTLSLQERSHPAFVPSKLKQGSRKRLGSNVGRGSCSPTAAELQNRSPALNQSTASSAINQPQEITAMHNDAPELNQMGHIQSECSTNSTKAQQTELSQEVLCKQQSWCEYSVHEGRDRENCKVQFDDSVTQGSLSQSSQEANAAQITRTERPMDLSNRLHSHSEIKVNREKSLCLKDVSSTKEYSNVGRLVPGAFSEQKELIEGKEQLPDISNSRIMPQPPVKLGASLSLLDLQNSFSKSKAHRNFNSSITHATVNLRDNVVKGKKHDFCGINCYYLRG